MTKFSATKQRGFSLLTGFILSIIMFGTLAFFLAGQGINAGFGSSYSNTSKVSALLASAGYINTGFDAVTLGGTTPATVTFDTTTTTGVFNPTSGGASPQSLDPTLFQGRAGAAGLLDGYWIYRGSAVILQGVGTPSADYTMIVSGLKLSACQQINTTLHGTALSATPTALTSNDSVLMGNTPLPTAASPSQTSTAADLSLQGVSGWANGCYASATAGNYVYIHTLLAQ